MRLINTSTFALEEFWDETAKPYTILSHRWEGKEVSFQDMQDIAKASGKKGFEKYADSASRLAKTGVSVRGHIRV